MKLFLTGLFKTGTSSLHKALETYNLCGAQGFWPKRAGFSGAEVQAAMKLRLDQEQFDFYRGFPWLAEWEWLEENIDGARFIHTVRDERNWLASATANWPTHNTPIHQHYIGAAKPSDHPMMYIDMFRRHNAALADFARAHPNRAMVLNVFEENSLNRLDDFLKIERNRFDAFPHENETPAEDYVHAAVRSVLDTYDAAVKPGTTDPVPAVTEAEPDPSPAFEHKASSSRSESRFLKTSHEAE